MSTIELFLRMVHANGRRLNRNEERMILAAVMIFQVDYDSYHRLKEPYFPETEKYYAKLNCQPADSVDKIKDSYRRLAMKYHPDKLQVHDLPITLRELANDKFREIQEAYKVVRKDRGF
jgi:DnaJ like chaperone protein